MQLKALTCVCVALLLRLYATLSVPYPTVTTCVIQSIAIVENPNSSYYEGYFDEAA